VADRDFELASDTETRTRAREVGRLIELIEPNPQYRPWFVSDRASLLDCLGADEAEMLAALRREFGPGFALSLRQPVWRLVDEIRSRYPGWPAPRTRQ
jgi:glutathione S-transferase